jgi:excisionase family DNA binding protein
MPTEPDSVHLKGPTLSVIQSSHATFTESVRMLLTVAETAELLRLSTSSVWRLSKSGEMPKPIHVGGRRLWRRDQLMAWIEAGGDAAPAVNETAKPRRGRPRKTAVA